MCTDRRKRLVERGWYVAYLSALAMAFSLFLPPAAHAYCPTYGTQDCSQSLGPCPNAIPYTQSSDYYDPNSGCGTSSNMCRSGTCYFYYNGELCWTEDFSYCILG